MDKPHKHTYRSWHYGPDEVEQLRRFYGFRSSNQVFEHLVEVALSKMRKSAKARKALDKGNK